MRFWQSSTTLYYRRRWLIFFLVISSFYAIFAKFSQLLKLFYNNPLANWRGNITLRLRALPRRYIWTLMVLSKSFIINFLTRVCPIAHTLRSSLRQQKTIHRNNFLSIFAEATATPCIKYLAYSPFFLFEESVFVEYFSYICRNISIYTWVFVVLADEPRKFIYGKRRRTLLRVRMYLSDMYGHSVGCCFFSSYHRFS